MTKLKNIRELQNLTQEELSNKSGISVRTIQRIETGKEPKGHTLRVIAKALDVKEKELIVNESYQKFTITEHCKENKNVVLINYSLLKLINLSSILFIVMPPLNIIIPVLLMLVLKQKNNLTKQLISVQILWTIIAPIVFLLGIFMKLGKLFTMILLIVIVLSNIFIILRNAFEIDRKQKLYCKLNFNLI
ncbi:protein of unknown function [Flavobacterium micromati]|uniref:HTH cro/C1-type domain-containing protein n=1 Tax=Flavobacterium micromati TaxID=229205 RepID=A0A1M5P9P1_9FLAO|nr:helix-turn-helix domain-containing protein [Flavobacterium micromati]SHG98415.1 protein of unknown function [Flavobacterium micromati]